MPVKTMPKKPKKKLFPGKKLQALRESKEMTQKQLADKSGHIQQTIDRWERGIADPRWADVIDLAKALEVDVGYFLPDPPEAPDTPPTESPK